MNNKKQHENDLGVYIEAAISTALDDFQLGDFRSLLEEIEKRFLKMLQSYSSASKQDNDFIEKNYPKFEHDILTFFLSVVPRIKRDYDLSDRHKIERLMENILSEANLELSDFDKNYFINKFHDVLRVYAGLSKIEDEKAEEIYERQTKTILKQLRSITNSKTMEEKRGQLRLQIDHAVNSANLDLPNYQKESLEDQFLWLYRDYLLADEEERDEVYIRGEERIIMSIFDPAIKPKTQKHSSK